jgi:L-amino acid N-acyltransferase YncA
MEKKARLKDGSPIVIRELKQNDLDRSFAFFSALPKEDRAYLRVDVTKRDVVARRIKLVDSGAVFRLVALSEDDIVADGALELGAQEWNKHIAEIRLIVAHTHQRKGLGMLIARELFLLASKKKIEEIIVEFMGPQVGARKIFERLGFHEDAVLRNYVRDIDRNKQDLILMRCDLESIWQKLDDFIAGSDWQRTR